MFAEAPDADLAAATCHRSDIIRGLESCARPTTGYDSELLAGWLVQRLTVTKDA